jgi:hypothetical protein
MCKHMKTCIFLLLQHVFHYISTYSQTMVTIVGRSPSRGILCLLVALLLTHDARGHSSYSGRSPNGNSLGGGLGHLSSSGGGDRNSYGIAFKNAGYQWTVSLCLVGVCKFMHCTSFLQTINFVLYFFSQAMCSLSPSLNALTAMIFLQTATGTGRATGSSWGTPAACGL